LKGKVILIHTFVANLDREQFFELVQFLCYPEEVPLCFKKKIIIKAQLGLILRLQLKK